MHFFELFGILTFPIILLIKFVFPYQLQIKLTGTPNLICKICTGDKHDSQILACRAPQNLPSDFYGNNIKV
jgi:hypothetical protein